MCMPFTGNFIDMLQQNLKLSNLRPLNPEILVMRTSAKNTGYSEVLIFILELLSEVESDCH